MISLCKYSLSQNVVQSERLLLVECSVHTVTVCRLEGIVQCPGLPSRKSQCVVVTRRAVVLQPSTGGSAGTHRLSPQGPQCSVLVWILWLLSWGSLVVTSLLPTLTCVSPSGICHCRTVYPWMLYFLLFEIRSPYVALSGLKLSVGTRLASDFQRSLHFCCSLLGLWLCTAMPAQGTCSFSVGQILVDFVCLFCFQRQGFSV